MSYNKFIEKCEIFYNNKKFTETTFKAENLYEDLIIKNAKLLFGERSIYIA